MKIILTFIIIFSTQIAYSQIEDEVPCETEAGLGKLNLELNYSCSRKIPNESIFVILSSPTEDPSKKEFCDNCKAPQIFSDAKLKPSEFNTENKKQFTKSTLNELRKNLSGTMIDLMSLRSTFSMNFNPAEAIKSCSIDQLAESKCKDGSSLNSLVSATLGSEDSFQNIQKDLSYEIANTLNPENSNKNGLLKRHKSSCGIQDNEFLNAKMKYWESLLTPEVINILKNAKIDASKDLFSQLADLDIPKQIQSDLKKASLHPMIQSMFKSGKTLRTFLHSFKGEFDKDKITENLFSESNSAALAKNLANRCRTAFESIKKTFCSQEYKEGNLLFSDFDSMKMNLGADPLKENKEEKLSAFCQGIKSKNNKPLLFSEVNKNLSQELPAKLKKLNFSTLSEEYYTEAFYSPKEQICPLLSDGNCNLKEMNCSISKFITAARAKDSPQSKLLASHDPNIDKILGSLIGTAPSVDDKTKIFLTEQGILPRADGTIVQAKDNDIRNPKTYSSSVRSFESGNGKSPEQIKQVLPNKAAKTNGGNEWQSSDIGEENNEDHPSNNAAPKKSKKLAKDNSEDGPEDNNNTFKENFKKRLNSLKNRTSGKNPTQETTHSPSANTGTNTAGLGGGSMIQDGAFVGETLGAPSTPEFSQTKSGYSTLDKTTAKKDSKNDALLNANRKPAEDDKVKNSTITLSKTSAGLNQIEIKVPDESILHENTQELEKKIEDYLDASAQSLQGAKTGEAFFVKLGSYEIKVAINDHGVYVAKCTKECSNLSTEYLRFLSKYFTQIKKGNLRERLKNTINKIIKKNPNDPKDKTDLE